MEKLKDRITIGRDPDIAQRIWESVLEHPETVLLTQTQNDELERRWRAFEQNPDEGEPWEDVKRSLLSE